MPSNQPRTPLSRKIAALQAGTAKHIAGQAVVNVFGITLTAADVAARLAAHEARFAAVATARAALITAAAEYQASVPRTSFFVRCYTSGLRELLGADSPKLRDFGIEPRDAKREAAKLRRWARGARTRRERRARRAYVERTLATSAASPLNEKNGETKTPSPREAGRGQG